MFNIGPQELLVVLILALIVVGPKRLPELGRTIGRGLNEFRKIQDEVKDMVKFDLGTDPTDVEDPIESGTEAFGDPHEFDPESESDESEDDGGTIEPPDDEMTHSERVIAAMTDDEVGGSEIGLEAPLDEGESAAELTPPTDPPAAAAAE